MDVTAHKIRPAARLLRTVGQDLVKDVYAAIVELVKNSYDADSKDVVVSFSYDKGAQTLVVDVVDKGDGMSLDTVVNKWLVPATSDKLIRKRSARNRVLQGRKGIGRFAASILGSRITLETVQGGYLTKLNLDMEKVESFTFLDELELDVTHEKTPRSAGTSIKIETFNLTEEKLLETWTPKQLKKLLLELRSLTAPQEVFESALKQGFKIEYDQFDIKLQFYDFPLSEYSNKLIKIEPFPVLDLFDYRISGKVSSDGHVSLSYQNQNVPSLKPEQISVQIPLNRVEGQVYPGELYVDIRAYDRDPDSITNMIERGLKDPDTGSYVGKNEARRILDEYYGVGIYREQFKIRPYGDQEFDWLDLDKKRVQDPSRKIGHNQVIGFVYVRHEEHSGLEEKSARDGLIENGAYFGLTTILSTIIKQLEVRRFRYRDKAQKGGRGSSIEDDLTSLFNFDKTKDHISSELDRLKTSPELLPEVKSSISKILTNEENKKANLERKIRDTIAVYQGQATLGKITHVLLHEGRKHIKYINETAPRVAKWVSKVIKSQDSELIEKINDRSRKVVTHSKGLSYLFKKIEPLARTRRSPNKKLNLVNELQNIGAIFESDFTSAKIQFELRNHGGGVFIECNEVDLITVFSNLIENSIFWISQKADAEKTITIDIYAEGSSVELEYKDSGPGFQGGNLDLMFEPGYSMKPDGTGLGLSLAGEAMSRIGGKIEAKHSTQGAVFDIVIKGTS
ncbi:ATP-binding protein [Pseudoalteromonas maricaloris]|uniref:sensor histidine kinase n=1 Tax=Pseudoalteromonas maricaloris TaxID=184924 RepID=UPI0021ADD75E|nr:sensor histidine kinase [Pseudoalteromonas flavipulchra]USE68150.1 ATP-binding protein [Pseudoalteromonas flavipulchra]